MENRPYTMKMYAHAAKIRFFPFFDTYILYLVRLVCPRGLDFTQILGKLQVNLPKMAWKNFKKTAVCIVWAC